MIKTLLPTVLFALTAVASPANATTAMETTVATNRIVDASDLDLTTASGKDTLDRRLAVAVKAVCAADEPGNLPVHIAVRACRNHAREGVIAQRNAMVAAAREARAHAVLATK